MYFCPNCKKICANQLLYERHKLKCKIETQELAPKDNSILRFEKYQNKLFRTLNIYAAIEAILKTPEPKNLPQNNSKKDIYQTHEALGIGYYLVSQFSQEKSYYRSYWRPNIGKWFAEELYNIALLYADVGIFSFIYLSEIVNI